MAIDIKGYGNVLVAKPLRDNFRVDSFLQQEGGVGVTQIMKPNFRDLRLFDKCVERPMNIGGVIVLACRSQKHIFRVSHPDF